MHQALCLYPQHGNSSFVAVRMVSVTAVWLLKGVAHPCDHNGGRSQVAQHVVSTVPGCAHRPHMRCARIEMPRILASLVGYKPVVALPVEALCNPVLHARLLFHSTPAQVICVDISLTSNLEAAPSLSRGESASMDETAWASTANETRQGPHKQQGMQGQPGMHEKQGQHGPQAALQTSAKEQRAAAAAGKAPLPSLPPPRRSNGSFGKCLILRSHKGGLSR